MQHIDRNKDGFVNFQEFAGALSTRPDGQSTTTDSALSTAVRRYFLQSRDGEGHSGMGTTYSG